MIESAHYTLEFYSGQQEGSYTSAQVILPLVNELFAPKSVIDVGCGVGYWLKVWNEQLGVQDYQGVEGPYVSADMLKIPAGNVLFQDLKSPIDINRKFDLAMSMEVAEHLPNSHAKSFVQTLISFSDVILFSAAIEGQEGTYHINEQFPEYWSKIFAQFDFVPVDYLRPKIWNNPKVEWWYQQNALIYIKKNRLNDFPLLADAYEHTDPNYLVRIHPWIFRHKLQHISKTTSWEGFARWKLYPLKKYFQSLFKKK